MFKNNKIIKYLLRTALVLAATLLLLLVLLNLPPVQQWLTDRATEYVQKKTNTTVQIGGLNLRLPNSLLLKELYVEDTEQDTLVYIGQLKTGFSLTGLLSKRIEITGVQLRDVTADVHPLGDGMMNYQFLIDAFMSGGPSPENKETPSGDKGWTVYLAGASVELKNIRAYYLQLDSTMEMSLDLQTLNVDSREVDLKRGLIDLERIALRNTRMSMHLKETQESPADTTESTARYRISSDEILLEEIAYALELPELKLGAEVGLTAGQSLSFQLSPDTIAIASPAFDLRGGAFRYDVPGEPPMQGFDYNHMALDSIAISLRDFTYDNLDIRGVIEQARAADKSGIALTGLQGKIHYTLDSIRVSDLEARTRRSLIRAPSAFVSFPFIRSDGELSDMRLEVDIPQAFIHPEEVPFFVPKLLDYPVFQQSFAERLSLQSRISGKLGDLRIHRFDLRGWGSQLTAEGRLREVLDPEQAQVDLKVPVIQIAQRALQTWIPEGMLPDSIELPQEIRGQLQTAGTTRKMDVVVNLQSSRQINTLASSLKVSGEVRHLLDQNRLSYRFQLDTFFTTREALRTLLPSSTLPDDLLVIGDLYGTLDKLNPTLNIYARRGTNRSHLNVSGHVNQFRNTELLQADIRLDSIDIAPDLIAAFLPHDLLPPYLRMPAVQSGYITLRGGLKDLKTGLVLQTSLGDIESEGSLQDSSYRLRLSLEDFDPEMIFEPAAYDSLVGRDLSEVSLYLNVDGAGFDPNDNLNANVSLQLRPEAPSLNWDEGLLIQGTIRGNSFQASASVEEPGMQLSLNSDALFRKDSLFRGNIQLDLSELNLRTLRLSDHLIFFNTQLQASIDGQSTNQFQGNLALRSANLRFDSILEHVDSFLVDVNFQPEEKEMLLHSDVAEGFLRGQFEYPEVIQQIRSFIRSYLDPTYAEYTQPDSSGAYFDFDIEFIRPGILTSGLIPELTDFSPSKISGRYDAFEEQLFLESNIPRVQYAGIAFDSLSAGIGISRDTFGYRIRFRRMNGFEQIQAENLVLQGRLQEGRVINQLIQHDEQGERRFDVVLYVDPKEDQVRFHFRQKAILNYKEWQFSEQNEVLISRDTLMVQDWRLAHEGQYIQLRDRRGQDLLAGFQNFDLQFVANTLKYQSNYVAGLLNGEVTLNTIRSEPKLDIDFTIDSLNILEANLGRLQAVARQGEREGSWEGQLDFAGEGHDFTLGGSYQPDDGDQQLAFRLDAQRIDLAELEPLSMGALQQTEGSLSGQIDINGNTAQPNIEGSIQFQSAAFMISQLQVLWQLGDQPITFQKVQSGGRQLPAVQFNQLTLTDPNGDQFILEGRITAPDFSRFQMDLKTTANSFLVMDTEQADNDLYYGQIEADLDGLLSGPLDSASVVMNVRTAKTSRVVYNYPTDAIGSVESGEGIIEFRAPDTLGGGFLQQKRERQPSTVNPLGWDFTINASINDNLNLRLITNPITGDRFVGKGEGNITLRLSPRGNISLSGQVEILEGDYLFSYTELVKRTFTVIKDSYISWTGDPAQPELLIKARYTTKASPLPIMPVRENSSPAEVAPFKRRQEFNVLFTVSGRLNDLEVNTEIEYPNTPFNTNNMEIETAIERLNQNDSQTNTQAFSLLLFNGFMSTSMASSNDMQVINITQGLNDLLTNYLNNFAEQYISFVNIDFSIESSSEEVGNYFDNTDFRVSVQKSFLNDRLTVSVDGIASSQEATPSASTNTNEMQAYLDNITVEYALTTDGRLRIKLYNQHDRDDFLGGDVIKFGGAIVFSRDFQKLRLFPGKQQAEEPVPPPDSTRTDSTKNLINNE